MYVLPDSVLKVISAPSFTFPRTRPSTCTRHPGHGFRTLHIPPRSLYTSTGCTSPSRNEALTKNAPLARNVRNEASEALSQLGNR